MLKRAIVVGASSGIGATLVRKLAHEGYQVAAVARRIDRLDELARELNIDPGRKRIFTYAHDVVDTQAAPMMFERIVSDLDGLDLIVYCAGFLPKISEEQYETVLDRQIIEVNIIGMMSWLNLAAMRFQVQKGGIIVGIGSIAGERGRRRSPAYDASKAAVHSYLESLRNRLSGKGVHVLTVRPGPIRTPMTEGWDRLPFMIDVEPAVDRIFHAIARRQQNVYVPALWGLIMPIIRSIPSILFRRMRI